MAKVKGKTKSKAKKKVKKTIEEKDPGGRPVKMTKELKGKILELLANDDLTIKEICEKLDIHHSTIYSWLGKDEGFSELFARAREIKAHRLVGRAEAIAKEIEDLTITNYNAEASRVKVNVKKVAFDMNLRLAGKLNRPVYGERKDIDVTSMGKRVAPVMIVDDLDEK